MSKTLVSLEGIALINLYEARSFAKTYQINKEVDLFSAADGVQVGPTLILNLVWDIKQWIHFHLSLIYINKKLSYWICIIFYKLSINITYRIHWILLFSFTGRIVKRKPPLLFSALGSDIQEIHNKDNVKDAF